MVECRVDVYTRRGPLRTFIAPDAGAFIGTPNAIYVFVSTGTILAVALVVNF